jgi:hypothetical protein
VYADYNDTSNASLRSIESDDLYCYEVMSPVSPSDIATLRKEHRRWSLATHHVRREYGFVSLRERLWIMSTLACSRRAFVYQRKAVTILKNIWLRRVERNCDKLKGMAHIRFILPDEYQFSIPLDNEGSTLVEVYEETIFVHAIMTYYLDIMLKASPCSLGTIAKEDRRWNFALHHVRREYGLSLPRETLWIQTTLASSLRAYVWERKADNTLRKIWLRKIRRDPEQFTDFNRVTFILLESCRISQPIAYCWTHPRA